jgi:predicted glycosyltransferase
MRIWVDLSNSPHPLLFEPLLRHLEARGHTSVLTARDNAQTVELARQRWPDVSVIGDESPRSRIGKAAAILGRVARLRQWARRERPDLALSHNSYAQIVAARSLAMPIITAMDYEHQPANHLAFRLADRVLLPEALRSREIRRQGAAPSKTSFYHGLKEELYLGDFQPNPDVLAHVDLERRHELALVVLRTPPSRAAYHRLDNPLFAEALRTLSRSGRAQSVVLTRHREQREEIAALKLERCTVPDRALDSRSLMYQADLVIGAGGTMTREAALLGVRTLTMFAGRRPAADQWLEQTGRLGVLHDVSQLDSVSCGGASAKPLGELRARSRLLIDQFTDVLEGMAP